MQSVLLLPMFVAIAAAGCGLSDRAHPPRLSMSSSEIYGLRAGIVGGAEAEPHSYPWQVWIFQESGGGQGFACGGALISPDWVVTASHCVADDYGVVASASKFRVYLGMHTVWQATDHGASRVIKHPKYNGNAGNGYDIALIKLSKRATYTDKVQPICLPSGSDSWRKDGENVVVSGWGGLATGAQGPDQLHHVVLATDFNKNCVPKWRIGQDRMCAIGNGKDSCQGDSGGPLVARRNGKFVLAGVVSYGGDCAQPGLPGVYAHVPYYRNWIRSTTGV